LIVVVVAPDVGGVVEVVVVELVVVEVVVVVMIVVVDPLAVVEVARLGGDADPVVVEPTLSAGAGVSNVGGAEDPVESADLAVVEADVGVDLARRSARSFLCEQAGAAITTADTATDRRRDDRRMVRDGTQRPLPALGNRLFGG